MKLSDFDYNLPPELIAQEPAEPRDSSRLLVLDKDSGDIEHKCFYELDEFLKKGDVLVVNNSKVIPARLIGSKKETHGRTEVFLHRKTRGRKWECLLKGKNIRPGTVVVFDRGLEAEVKDKSSDETWVVEFNKKEKELIADLYSIGHTPLPPYIKRKQGEREEDRSRYQTVYAKEGKRGSVAAPTAGLHFTDRMIKKLQKKGIEFEYVTLHVGLGTFAPVKTENIKDHGMHAEWAEVKKTTLESIIKAKKEGRRVVAVGTTSVRTLEAIFQYSEYNRFLEPNYELRITNYEKFSDWVNIFIYPGFKFQVVDAMLTNFHLPKSTLLMLISAFAGKDTVDKAYQEAIKEKYRFYSYGDAMLIY
jgi:S-adenosylmethionine:tRNA ribosyltransferase-isomerase